MTQDEYKEYIAFLKNYRGHASIVFGVSEKPPQKLNGEKSEKQDEENEAIRDSLLKFYHLLLSGVLSREDLAKYYADLFDPYFQEKLSDHEDDEESSDE